VSFRAEAGGPGAIEARREEKREERGLPPSASSWSCCGALIEAQEALPAGESLQSAGRPAMSRPSEAAIHHSLGGVACVNPYFGAGSLSVRATRARVSADSRSRIERQTP
jgi:hypothetical protein